VRPDFIALDEEQNMPGHPEWITI